MYSSFTDRRRPPGLYMSVRRRHTRTVYNNYGSAYVYSQVTDFVRGYDDARKSARVLYDGDAVDFLKTFVHHARSTDVRESYTRAHTKDID